MEITSSFVGYLVFLEHLVLNYIPVPAICNIRHLQYPGRHCCLWCLISQDQLKVAPDIRGPVQLRTIQGICSDHKRFEEAGSILKNVKKFHNCLNPPFFSNFPLSQVCTIDNMNYYNA